MYVHLDSLPLPAADPSGRARRNHIAGRVPDQRSIERFQRVASALAGPEQVPQLDGIASAARQLLDQHADRTRLAGIRQRARCLRALRMLASEPAWQLDPELRERIQLIADYATGSERLLPDAVPVVGGLDYALLVDLAMPRLIDELDAYLDFRRLRIEEAILRGERPHELAFGRDEWLEARQAELRLLAHILERGRQTYLEETGAPRFQVH
ncbi:hypothetical protein [Luteimonas sp. MC1572]|uniref:hypothetical protein n=1 Tax=Luteimonas sp. MC1572 TaxID=2799325 RepID=UPI0018F0D738|nr:hypothetical protein [Luteimonas sp. MC1572]MBJ6980449.1 hypothetical protein [Luteimonas sp. MC1572]QQO04329.1 hypothetical protein JGR64_06210 [Luteimonas sp. MC1572]